MEITDPVTRRRALSNCLKSLTQGATSQVENLFKFFNFCAFDSCRVTHAVSLHYMLLKEKRCKCNVMVLLELPSIFEILEPCGCLNIQLILVLFHVYFLLYVFLVLLILF